IAAAARYRDAGVAAAVLCECVAPPEDASIDERASIEGALGDLRWAVLVEDGRVLVDYSEYTIADFPGAAAIPAVAPDAGDSVLHQRTALQCVETAGEVPPSLSNLLSRVLGSVIITVNHDDAGRLAAQGFVAYTPDGYRYDRFGRRYSVPSEMCLGPRAYEMAVEKAREAQRLAERDSEEKAGALTQVEDEVRRLESALKAALEATEASTRLRNAIPDVTARLDRMSAEAEILAAELRALRRQLTAAEVSRAVTLKDLDAVRESYERWKKSAELPSLKQRLSEAREAEGAARKAADVALEDTRRLVDGIDEAARQIDGLERSMELGRARVNDMLDRLQELEARLSDKRLSLRDLQERTAGSVEEWRRAFDRPDISDDEALAEARLAAVAAPPVSEERRVTWHRRQVEIAPTVEALKPDIIPTAEEDYASAKEQFDKAQDELERVKAAYDDAASKESSAQENFKKVMLDTFHRISSRFSRYMEEFGWTGFLQVEPVQGTQFELHIYVSVYQGIEPRPLLRNRSGGETSAIAALLTLAMVKEYRRPFYVFDEIDQSLDPANVLKIASLLREELDRKYIIISHRLNKAHLELGQFGIGVYRSQEEGSRTRVYRRKEWPVAGA
ncbi:MAG: hypothetical protein ACM3WT_08660, partial [Bacillota bacterium]